MEILELTIKNMVCERCCMMVESQLQNMGLEVLNVELGSAKVKFSESAPSYEEIGSELKKLKFELVSNRQEQLI